MEENKVVNKTFTFEEDTTLISLEDEIVDKIGEIEMIEEENGYELESWNWFFDNILELEVEVSMVFEKKKNN